MDLNDKERATLAFSLFTSAMRMGPDNFQTIQAIAEKTGVLKEYEGYAKDWISYAKTVTGAERVGVTPFLRSSEVLPDPRIYESMSDEQRFAVWLAQLYYTTANETKLQPAEIKINEQEARKWYDSGATPYQCFRETWNMENDAEAF